MSIPYVAFRYYPKRVRRSWWATVQHCWQTWKWERWHTEYVAVKSGEPGYEDAPYETSVLWHR